MIRFISTRKNARSRATVDHVFSLPQTDSSPPHCSTAVPRNAWSVTSRTPCKFWNLGAKRLLDPKGKRHLGRPAPLTSPGQQNFRHPVTHRHQFRFPPMLSQPRIDFRI
jgi:hypothetical protein